LECSVTISKENLDTGCSYSVGKEAILPDKDGQVRFSVTIEVGSD
jgi:hypothetical protein